MFKLTYTKEFNFTKIKKYKFVIGLLLATAVAAYSNTLDVPEPVVIQPTIVCPTCPKPTVCPKPVVFPEVIPCSEPIVCPDCPQPESPIVITPDIVPEPEQPAWYLGGDGKDESIGNDDTDDEDNNDNGLDGHGQDHGGHGSSPGAGHNK